MGKVIDFESFKRKRTEELEEDEEIQQNEGIQTVKENKNIPVWYALFEQEIGIPLQQAIEKNNRYIELHHCGTFNSTSLQAWVTILSQETLTDLWIRVRGLNDKHLNTHPTYVKAVMDTFRLSLEAAIKEFKARHNIL